MSKRTHLSQEELNNLEKQIRDEFAISETELEKVIAESQELTSRYEESVEKLQGVFVDAEADRLAEEELRQMAEEMGVSLEESSDKELEKQIETLPDEAYSEDLEILQLLTEMNEEQQALVGGRLQDVSVLLRVHSDIAESAREDSSDAVEKERLAKFVKGARSLSSNIDQTVSNKESTQEAGKDNSNRLISIIGLGVKKLYNGLKFGISSTIDNIKKLGKQLGKSISSLFNKTPEKQKLEFSKTIVETSKALDGVKITQEGLDAAKAVLKKQFIKLQKDYAQVISPEKQEIFKLWQQKKNDKIDEMSVKELYGEVKKIRQGILVQKKKNLEARRSKSKTKFVHKPKSSGREM